MDTARLPPPLRTYWGWQEQAACRGTEAAIFFAGSGESDEDRRDRVDRAKAVSRQCPAQAECRAFALRTREPYGVWGGLSEADRAKLLGLRNLRYPGDKAPRRRAPATTSVGLQPGGGAQA